MGSANSDTSLCLKGPMPGQQGDGSKRATKLEMIQNQRPSGAMRKSVKGKGKKWRRQDLRVVIRTKSTNQKMKKGSADSRFLEFGLTLGQFLG